MKKNSKVCFTLYNYWIDSQRPVVSFITEERWEAEMMADRFDSSWKDRYDMRREVKK